MQERLPFCALRPSKGNGGLMSANQPARLTMLMILSLLLISYGVGNIRCSTVPDNSTDMLSLLDFKLAINDPRRALRSWNTSVPHCKWEGVNCSLTHPGRVTALNLSKLRLSGPISPSLGNLTFLKILDLSTNGFTGELPPFNRLRKLQELVLSTNSLQGTIPDTLTNCSNLKTLDLSGNFLIGEIPLNIGLLSSLSVLQISRNNLTGTIPTSLKNISQLLVINLADNQLKGSIPEEIGQFPHLFGLLLGGNSLSGGIPTTLFNQSYLQILDLTFNMIGKALPSNFGDTLPRLTLLGLNNNKLEGHVPVSLGKISGLERLGLSYNNFIGQVPSSLGNLGMLKSLYLQNNSLEAKDTQSWEFIDALSNCKYLKVLALGQNQFQGAIPNTIGNLSKLEQLGLNDNDLSGTVPTSIGNLSGLMVLDLRHNKLNGSIEGWIGKLKNMTLLGLDGNNFTGPIPSSIGNLSRLIKVYLSKNEFEGAIPPSIGNLTMLTELNLSYNNLHGNIPKEIFRTASTMTKCALSYNKLEGPIAPEISNLINLNELYLSSNQLTGEIPATLGKCQELQIMEMAHNFLTGSVPMTLGGLPILEMLNLSHNNLSGSIPKELGGLRQLTLLDLSYNNLEGGVPRNGVFENANSVTLRGNRGLCGGILDLPPCPTMSRRKRTQYYLIRVLIPVFGLMSLILVFYFVLTEKMRRSKYVSLPPFGEQLLKVSYDDLSQATQNFSQSNLIGKGGYGSVYRGKLVQGKLEVAVKVLDLDMHGAEKSFLSECEALRNIKHRNLVPIITACSTVDMEGNLFKALIYEFMPNGNLDTWLHHKGDEKAPKSLGLTQRINIIVNIADALDYLHNDSGSRSIIHCDVKPSNILLDDDMTAHLGDFGIASFYRGSAPTDDPSTISFGVKGTIGYIGPEYAGGGHASTYGDVYSFGIVILEMLTGKRPTDPTFENGLNIVNFVEGNFPDQILQVIDEALLEQPKPLALVTQPNTVKESDFEQCLCCLLEVALSCTRQQPRERMNMRQATGRVRSIKASYLEGKTNDVSSK